MNTSFLDTNVLIYALGKDGKAEIARELLDGRAHLGVQCLNEFASVAMRKLGLGWPEIDGLLDDVRRKSASIIPLTLDTHVNGVRVAARYRLSIYDAMIVAAALGAGCDTLYSEDMHHGLVVDGRLTIINPFRA